MSTTVAGSFRLPPLRGLAAAALLCLLALAVGCGRKGDPRPKSDVASSVSAPHPAAEKRA